MTLQILLFLKSVTNYSKIRNSTPSDIYLQNNTNAYTDENVDSRSSFSLKLENILCLRRFGAEIDHSCRWKIGF